MLKKLLSIVISGVLSISLLAGCGKQEVKETVKEETKVEQSIDQEELKEEIKEEVEKQVREELEKQIREEIEAETQEEVEESVQEEQPVVEEPITEVQEPVEEESIFYSSDYTNELEKVYGYSPYKQLCDSIEASGDYSQLPDAVVYEYLINIAGMPSDNINDSVGNCPLCHRDNQELTGAGYCLPCSYDYIVFHEEMESQYN